MTLHSVETSSTTLQPIVSRIDLATQGVDRDLRIIACITMAILVSKPNIEPEQLQEAIWSTSQHICLLLDPQDNGAN